MRGIKREVVRHVAFVAVAEVLAHVLRPLVGLGQKHSAGITFIHGAAHAFEHGMRLGQVLVVGAFAHAQVRNRVEAHAVHAHVHPEAHDLDHRLDHFGIVVIQVGLMREEPVPVVLARHRVPRPVGAFGIGEDDARAGEFLVVVAPYVELSLPRSGRCQARGLKPGMLIGGVVDDQFGDHLQAAAMRFVDELPKVLQRAVVGMYVGVVGNVVTVVAQWRRIERQQPDGVDAQLLDVIELLRQAGEVADAVAVGVVERLDVHLVDDGVFVPKRIVTHGGRRFLSASRGRMAVDRVKRFEPDVRFRLTRAPRRSGNPG